MPTFAQTVIAAFPARFEHTEVSCFVTPWVCSGGESQQRPGKGQIAGGDLRGDPERAGREGAGEGA